MASLSYAQDPFEIQVFECEPLPRGAYTYEVHINYVPLQEQLHFSSELTAGADWKIRDQLTWSFGVGFGATDAGSRIILKSRFEFEFG